MSDKTRTVFHPALSGVSYEVPASDTSAWKDAGWRLTEPKDAKPAVEAPAVEAAVTN